MGREISKRSEETRKVILDFLKNPDNWEQVGSPVVKPATSKKYNIVDLDVKKRNKKIGKNLLSSLEHSVLGSTIMDWEPIHVLYKDVIHEFEKVKFITLVEALVKLLYLGYVECRLLEDTTVPVYELTKEQLLEHYGGDLSEDEMDIYPRVAVHEFRATQKGREEEASDLYNIYYPGYEE